jgi:oxygen-independent coproporphyrinogen-3 oxidase
VQGRERAARLTQVKPDVSRARQSAGVNTSDTTLAVSPELLRRFDVAGPRYTSYPTADRFVEAFGPVELTHALEQRHAGPAALSLPLSLYVHIPFCEQLCYYCACNKIITKKHERGGQYLRALSREIDMYTAGISVGRPVTQLHLGGGSPTFLADDELSSLMSMLRGSFDVAARGELSIEIDPRTVDAKRLAHIAGLGYNRISYGVQDFEPDVQQAVHRVQPFEQVASLMDAARKVGFDSVNVDLIYGLPRQTLTTFARTLERVVEIRPDRIALYGYAHLPERFKPQRRIHAADMPSGTDKIAMLSQAVARFQEAGYVYIGMDHFALPNDALAVAKRQGLLHRNFQGYSTQPDCDLIGLGVSAISHIGATYSQNAKTLEEYTGFLHDGRFPVVRGLALTRDDLARRAVIMAIMCQGQVPFESIELAWLLDFREYFEPELEQLRDYEAMGLVETDENSIQVTPEGWYVVRAIAMVFDRYLQADRNRTKFSSII